MNIQDMFAATKNMRNGGSFAAAIADAWACADSSNQLRIELAFADLFQRFAPTASKPEPNVNADELAMTAMYLMIGAEDERKSDPDTALEHGHLEMASGLVDFARKIIRFTNALPENTEYPGVFLYEVVEELGSWFMLNQSANPCELEVAIQNEWRKFQARH